MRFAAVYLIFVAALVALSLWFRRDGLRPLVAAGLGALLGIALSAGIGAIWDRPRPFVAGHFVPLITHAADASFPSDHLAALGAVTICLWWTSRRLGAIVAAIAVVVAFARVYVGVHYVSDVAGGFALGLACGGAMWWFTGRVLPAISAVDRLLVRLRVRPRAPAS
ncbi:MAG TPA: phosphatase PAP2 family protein [Candidatus Saccharimonadales bacterium]|nr:phosphatase PAP2 family protein [Candidatus Saccharimonadales bacterium]